MLEPVGPVLKLIGVSLEVDTEHEGRGGNRGGEKRRRRNSSGNEGRGG